MYFIICDRDEPVELVTDRDKAWLLAGPRTPSNRNRIEEYDSFGAALDRMKGVDDDFSVRYWSRSSIPLTDDRG